MAKYSNTVAYELRTTLDASGVSKLQIELVKVKKELDRINSVGFIDEGSIEKAKKNIREIQTALSKAFNPNIGLLNIDKFLGSLSKGNDTIADWGQTFKLAGSQGEIAMNSLVGRLGKIDQGLVSVSKTTDKIFNTLGNTVRWGLIASGFQSILNNAHEAVDYIKELDRSLNDIRIVSNYNAQDMREFSLHANETAKALGQTTVAYTDASLIFAQQGFNLEDSNKLAEMVLKVANTTGQATEEVSEQVTSWMNGYQMSIDQVGVTLDKVTKVAAVGAADTEELMTAASKVASTAHMLGVTEDQLITQMSTIISVTREAPENVGNALKTIYARLGDLKMGETLEDGTDLGKLSETLESVGVQVLDDTGAMRNMGDVLEELMGRWSSFDRAQQQALAVQLAGKYQYSRFSALMQNQEMYESQLQESIDSVGFLERTQDIYMESLAAKSKSLEAATEGLINNLFDPDAIKPFQQGLIDTIDLVSNFVDVIGGGIPTITALGSVLTRTFSKQISANINSAINNMSLSSQQKQTEKARQDLLINGLPNSIFEEQGFGTRVLDMVSPVAQYSDVMSPEQVQQYNTALEKTVQIENNRVQLKKNLKDLDAQLTIEMKNQLGILNEDVFRDEKGRIDNEKVHQALTELSLESEKDSKLAEYSKDLSFDLESVKEAQAAILDYTDGTYEYGHVIAEVSEIVKIFPSQIEVLTKAHGADEQKVQRLIHSYNFLEKALEDEEIDIKKLQKGLREYGETLDFLNQNVQEEIGLNQKAKRIQQERLQQILDLGDAEAQVEAIEEEWKQTQENLARQQNIQNIMNMTAAVGQLSSAIISMLNIGSIWGEESDLSFGERLTQTIMNLSFVILMLVSAIPVVSKGIQSIRTILDGNNIVTGLAIVLNKKLAQSQLDTARATLTKAQSDLKEKIEQEKRIRSSIHATAQAKREAIETRKAAQAIRDKAKANYEEAMSNKKKTATGTLSTLGDNIKNSLLDLGKSIGPQMGIMLAIGAATAFANFMITKTQEEFDRQSETAAQANEDYQNSTAEVNNFNTLYKTYKETGEGAEELKDKSKELIKSLKIDGGEVLLVADNFDQLAKKINESQDAAGRDALTKIGAFLHGSGASAMEGGWFKNGQLLDGSAYSDVLAKWDFRDETTGKSDYTNTSENRQDFIEAKNNGDLGGAYAAAQKELKDWQDDIQKYNEQIAEVSKAGGDTSQLEKARDILYEKYDKLNNVFNNEEWQQYITNLTNAASIESSMIENTLKESGKASDPQAIIEAYQNGEYTGQYLETLGSWSEQLEYMIAHTNDEAGKLVLSVEHGKAKADEGLQKLSEEDDSRLTDFLYNAANEDGMTIFAQLDSQLDEYGNKLFPTQEAKEDYLQSLLEEAIQSIENNPNLTDEQKSQILNAVNWDGPYNEILDSLTQSAIDAQQNVPSTLDLFSKMKPNDEDVEEEDFQQLGKYIVENADELEGYSAELSDNAEALADVTEEQLRYDAALQRSYDSMEDWEKGLNSDSISDRAKAVEELSNTYNDLLDVGQGLSVSSDFSSDIENLELLKRAIDGDTEAYDELQKKAAEDILLQFGMDSSQFEEQWAKLQAEFLDINGQNFADLEIGAELNDENFLAALSELVTAAGMTADEAQAFLSEMGIDAEVETEQAEQTDQQVYYNVVPNFHIVDGPTPQFPALTEDGLEQSVYSAPVQVPAVTYENVPVTIESSKTMSAFGLKTKTSNGQSSGGKLTVKNATKGGSGASKFQRTSAARPASKTSGSSGKGSGSSKSYTPKKKDKKDPKIDRYERVNTQIEYTDNEFEKINKEHDRLKGWNLADVMEEEIGLLEREIGLYEEKYRIQQQEAAELQSTLSQDYGATFDEEGLLTNYASIHQRLYDDYNNLIEQYSNTATEEGQNALAEQLEEAEEKLSDFEETYSRYDKLVAGEMKETLNTLEDFRDKIEDIRTEAFNTQIEALDNIRELNDALFEFNDLMNVKSVDDLDNPFKGLESSASKLGAYFDNASLEANKYYDNLIARSKEKLADPQTSDEYKAYLEDQIALMEEAKRSAGDGTIEQYGTGYFDMAASNLTQIMGQFDQFLTTGTSSIFGKNEAALYEAGQEVFMQFKDVLADFWADAQELRDKILDCIDDVGERIEERRAQYESITDELDHQRNIIEMLHGDKAYDEILNVLDAQQHNYDVSIGEMKRTLGYWTQMRDSLTEGSEEWKVVNEKIEETQQNLNELVESSLENLTESYTQNVNKMLDAWTNSALGNDLEWIEEEWELINRNADYYLDQTNAAYETQKLQNEYLKLLDGSNDLHVQEMISDQMKQQLKYLREKTNLSEYDVAYANAQLEILQKRIALEEAQRNKNQIKLRRDSQGNYSYVYTADQEDVAEKEGDLLDAQNNAYNLSKEQMRQTQADSLSALGDAKNLLNNIWTDTILTLDEKKKRTETVIGSLKEYLVSTGEQLSKSQENIINDFIGMAEMMSEENADRLADVYTEIINGNHEAFSQIDERWSTSLTNWLQTVDEFNLSTDDMFKQLTAKELEWEKATKAVGYKVGQDFDNMAGTIDNVRKKTDDLANSQANFINQIKSDAGVITNYEDTLNEYIAKISDAENKMNKYAQEIKRLQGELTIKEAQIANLTSQGNLGGSDSNSSSGNESSDTTGGELKVGSFVQLKPGHYYNYTSQGSLPAGNWSDAVKITHIAEDAPYPYHLGTKDANASDRNSGWRGWVRKEDLVGYDTGGYTGSWDDNEGRLAMLHQKEIVLNASDTENILKAVQAVRDMTTQLRSNIFNDIAAVTSLSGSFALGAGSDTVQQEVHITAEFPNVQDSNDIREALLSLNDQAMQYSSRKR